MINSPLSPQAPSGLVGQSPRPTNIRRQIIAVSMLMAFILYLDRICMGEIVKSVSFNQELHLSKEETGRVLAAFFFSYALLQVPAGWASDRFGPRVGVRDKTRPSTCSRRRLLAILDSE